MADDAEPTGIVLHFSMTPQDALRAGRLARRRVGDRSDLGFVGPLAVEALVLLSALSLWLAGSEGAALGIASVMTIATAAYLSYPWWGARLIAWRLPTAFGHQITARLQSDGLHSESGESSGRRAWSDMTDFIEDREYIVIRHRDRIPVAFIPKRAFATASDLEAFMTLLRAHVRPALAGKPPVSDPAVK